MSNVAKNKICGILLIVIVALLSSVCFGTLQWSYLSSCEYAFDETKVGIFREDGVACYGSTMVDPPNYAGVTVYLKTLDEFGDWVTVTAWQDKDSQFAAVDTDYAVDPGTYRIEVTHKAYVPSDLETPVEMFYTESESVTIY